MALKLRFSGQAQLWAELVLPRGERIFVPTTDSFEVGTQVPLQLETPDLTSNLTLLAIVVSHRPATPTTPAGVVLNLTSHSVERVEAALHALPSEPVLPLMRATPKPDRTFVARVLVPQVIEGCTVKSLSPTGMTLVTPTLLKVETTVVVALHLPDGEVQLPATVSWARAELSLMGLRISTLEPSMQKRIKHAVESEAPSAAEFSLPSGYTIVVADDDTSILDFMARVVSAAGHRVVRAERGDIALQLIKQERPKLIFLDVLMPGLDGLEVCSAVRAEASLSRTPVVLLSAMGEQRLADTVRESKANDYLTKPMKIDSVRAILSKYL